VAVTDCRRLASAKRTAVAWTVRVCAINRLCYNFLVLAPDVWIPSRALSATSFPAMGVSRSMACFSDGAQHACDADEVCGVGGACLKAIGTSCLVHADCFSGFCWSSSASAVGGVCCDKPCSGECNSCNSGVCEGRPSVPCRNPVNREKSSLCNVCRPVASDSSVAECRVASTICSAVGGLSGTDFGCNVDQSCFEGDCIDCASKNGTVVAATCGADDETFVANLPYINPTLQRLKFCDRWSISFYTIGAGCHVVWQPLGGAGVDCDMDGIGDGLVTAGVDERLKMFVEFPENSMVRLTFGNFDVGGDFGNVTVVHIVDTMGTEAEVVMSFDQPKIEIDYWVSRLYVIAIKGSFDLRRVEVLKSPKIATLGPTSTTTVRLADAVAIGTNDTDGGSRHSSSSNNSDATTTESGPNSLTDEKGFAERLNDGFAGKDDAYLGGFVAVLIVVILAVLACIVFGTVLKKKKKKKKKKQPATAESDNVLHQAQYAAVSLSPSLAYDRVPGNNYVDVITRTQPNYDVGNIN
jgi:hypothetical protein